MSQVTQDELDMARANLFACAYNAFVNSDCERGRRKMGDLGRALNYEERVKGRWKLEELVRRGIIESFVPCAKECVVRPGGLFHVKDCPNGGNSPESKARRRAVYDALPAKDQHLGYSAIVGGPQEHAR